MGATMMRLEQARRIAELRGTKVPTAVDYIDRALAKAGHTRSERRRLIKALKDIPPAQGDERNDK